MSTTITDPHGSPEICSRCGQHVTGSHYHCAACDHPGTTGMYGHHGTHCHVTHTQRAFHHCGPTGCALETEDPDAAG